MCHHWVHLLPFSSFKILVLQSVVDRVGMSMHIKNAKSEKNCCREKKKWWMGNGEVELRESSRGEIKMKWKIKENFGEIVEP